MLTTKVKRFNSFIDFLRQQYIKLIKMPDTKQGYTNRVAFCIYCAEYVKQGQQMYLDITDINISKQDIITFDFCVSQMANKLFVVSEELIETYITNTDEKNTIGKTDIDLIGQLIDCRNDMLYVSARWKTMRVMNVFDMDRERNKQKLPRRLPLLEEVCFCYDRVLETALGIPHEDGFNPNRGVACLPPSSGKTYEANCYTNLMTMHFWLRYGETGLIRMTNNATNAQNYGNQCVKMLQDDVWQKIFPEIRKYINSKGKIDLFTNNSAEKILLKDCNAECSDTIFMFGTDAGINGKRAQLGAVLDDLSDGVNDMDNDELHMKITDKVVSDVMDRSDDDDSPIIIQGTMYNQYDTQNTFIEKWKKEGLAPFKAYKFIQVTKDGKCFTCLVDIEDEHGHSIAPELYTDKKLQEKRDYFANRGKPYVYNLIYRQKRDSREPKTFDLRYFMTYDYRKPPKELNKYALTMIDTTRRSGNDWFSMPIFNKNNENGLYYWTDMIFEQKSLGVVDDPKNTFASEICKKIKNDNIVECCIESNTSNTTSALLKTICKGMSYNSCKFRDRYTSKKGKNSNKIVRILNMEETIKNYIVIPDPNTLPNKHPIKLALQYLSNWNSKEGQKKTNPDDVPDSLAQFCEEFIFKSKNRGQVKEVGNIW